VDLFLAIAGVIALVVIAVNLLITFGLMLVALHYTKQLVKLAGTWSEQGLAAGGRHVNTAAEFVDKAGRRIVEPVVQAEAKAAQTRRVVASLFPRR